MKKILNKTTMAIVLALTMLFALVGGLFLVKGSTVANAADTDVTITATADPAAVFPGGEFELTVAISTTDPGTYHSISVYIGVVDSSNAFDTAAQAKFKFATSWEYSMYTDKNPNGRTYELQDTSGVQKDGSFKMSLGMDTRSTGLDASEDIELKIKVTVDGTTDLKHYNFGAYYNSLSFVRTVNNKVQKTTTVIGDNIGSTLTDTYADVEVKQASNEKGIKLMTLGQGDAKDDLETEVINETDKKYDEIDKNDIKVTVTDPSAPLAIYLEFVEDGEKAVAKNGKDDVTLGKSSEGTYARFGKIDIPSTNVITLEVTAEDGTKDTYKITVTIVGAVLENIVATTNTKVGTKTGLEGSFDSATRTYNILVPDDATKIDFTVTVSAGNHRKDELELDKDSYGFSYSGSDVTGNKVAIQVKTAEFTVTGVSDDDVLKITCSASDGETDSSNTYTLTFKVLETSTAIDEITVTGVKNSKSSTNNAEKASASKVDYFFYIVGEGVGGQAKVVVTLVSGGAVVESIASTSYASGGVTLGEGVGYDITVTAEAGNKTHYKFTLENKIAVNLTSGASAEFIRLNEKSGGKYIQSYTAAGWTHGIDDVNEPKVVIGKIAGATSITQFLKNFSSADQAKIRLYDYDADGNENLLYDCGKQTSDYEDEDFDDPDYYSVGTGWRIEYIESNDPVDVIYLSVSGDLDGNGAVATGSDIGLVVDFVVNDSKGDAAELEFFMAALITNFGEVNAGDITALSNVFKEEEEIDDYWDTYEDS